MKIEFMMLYIIVGRWHFLVKFIIEIPQIMFETWKLKQIHKNDTVKDPNQNHCGYFATNFLYM